MKNFERRILIFFVVIFLLSVFLLSGCANAPATINKPAENQVKPAADNNVKPAEVQKPVVVENTTLPQPKVDTGKTCNSPLDYQDVQNMTINKVSFDAEGVTVWVQLLDETGKIPIAASGNIGVTVYRTKIDYVGNVLKNEIQFQKSIPLVKSNFTSDCFSQPLRITFAQMQMDRTYYSIKPDDRGILKLDYRSPGSTRAFSAEYYPKENEDLLPAKG